jgi:hypothetical protein
LRDFPVWRPWPISQAFDPFKALWKNESWTRSPDEIMGNEPVNFPFFKGVILDNPPLYPVEFILHEERPKNNVMLLATELFEPN